mmetsp:Transcript_13129/g.39120  ORF Transcript_13129/g.39120 Transcript_13129/m.39120 type:complete len:228 (-) Transcript_13129:95-778(-)
MAATGLCSSSPSAFRGSGAQEPSRGSSDEAPCSMLRAAWARRAAAAATSMARSRSPMELLPEDSSRASRATSSVSTSRWRASSRRDTASATLSGAALRTSACLVRSVSRAASRSLRALLAEPASSSSGPPTAAAGSRSTDTSSARPCGAACTTFRLLAVTSRKVRCRAVRETSSLSISAILNSASRLSAICSLDCSSSSSSRQGHGCPPAWRGRRQRCRNLDQEEVL